MVRSRVVQYFFPKVAGDYRFCRECLPTMPSGEKMEPASQGVWQPSQVFEGCVQSKDGRTAAMMNHFREFHPELCPDGVSTTRTVQRSDKTPLDGDAARGRSTHMALEGLGVNSK